MLLLSALPIPATLLNHADLQANGAGESTDPALFAALLTVQRGSPQIPTPAGGGKPGGKLLPEWQPEATPADDMIEIALPPAELPTLDPIAPPEPTLMNATLVPQPLMPAAPADPAPGQADTTPALPQSTSEKPPVLTRLTQAEHATLMPASQLSPAPIIPRQAIVVPTVGGAPTAAPVSPAQTVRLRSAVPAGTGSAEFAPAPALGALPPLLAPIREAIPVDGPGSAAPLFRDGPPAPLQLYPALITAGPEALRGQDFAALVDRLVQAREAAGTQPVQLALAHAEFGRVSLRFDTDESGLNVSLSSADPSFVRAVTAALPPASPSDASAQRSEARSEQGAGASDTPRGQSSERREGRSETRPETPRHQARPGSQLSHSAQTQHDGIFA